MLRLGRTDLTSASRRKIIKSTWSSVSQSRERNLRRVDLVNWVRLGENAGRLPDQDTLASASQVAWTWSGNRLRSSLWSQVSPRSQEIQAGWTMRWRSLQKWRDQRGRFWETPGRVRDSAPSSQHCFAWSRSLATMPLGGAITCLRRTMSSI